MKKEKISRRKFLETVTLTGGLLASGIGKEILAAKSPQIHSSVYLAHENCPSEIEIIIR